MGTRASILPWGIPWTEEPGGLQSTGSQSRTRLKRLSTHARVPSAESADAMSQEHAVSSCQPWVDVSLDALLGESSASKWQHCHQETMCPASPKSSRFRKTSPNVPTTDWIGN